MELAELSMHRIEKVEIEHDATAKTRWTMIKIYRDGDFVMLTLFHETDTLKVEDLR